ncbi:MAG: ABC transporter permease [Proteobacteria bacterium]|nr:ABC transporter permease [Pseudomonadota bacterium]MCL2306947.1 ABC transporter permease [Pseudomonadota bacterium]
MNRRSSLFTFSLARCWGVVLKEFLQLKRDRLTFAMVIGIPVMMLILFGYAINMDPKHLKTMMIDADRSEFSRSFIMAMHNTAYFDFVGELNNEAEGEAALARGDVQFVVNIPSDFSRRLVRGERPVVLVIADATDPAAASNAIGAVTRLAESVAWKDLGGPLARLNGSPPLFDVQVHRRYNPEGITQYNIVPGLMGVILIMTMVMITGLAMTRERERGTMENLLATPVRPLEMLTGKIVPYIFIGLIQATIILLAAISLFNVPFVGGILELYVVLLIYIAAALTVGITISSLARNQLQGVQMTFFFFLPNVLLSGFMFPFYGMPKWAQVIAHVLPMTYFNRLVRGIMLKGNSWLDLWPNVWPLMLFTVILMGVALKFYRRTLD